MYLTLNKAAWLPASVTAEMILLALVLVGGIVGLVFAALVIEVYDLDLPQTQLRRVVKRTDTLVDWLLAHL